MTREELFAKRERKLKEQKRRRLIMIGGIIAAALIVFLIVKIATGRVAKKPGSDSSVKTTEQTGAASTTTVSRTTESQGTAGTKGSTETAGTAPGVTETPAAQSADTADTASATFLHPAPIKHYLPGTPPSAHSYPAECGQQLIKIEPSFLSGYNPALRVSPHHRLFDYKNHLSS